MCFRPSTSYIKQTFFTMLNWSY